VKISRRAFGLSAIAGLAATAGAATGSARVPGGGFRVEFPKQGNSTPALVQAVRRATELGESTLSLPGGEYHFWPEGGTQRFLHVSNNDDALNDIIILLEGVENLHIRGDDTRLVFHGRVTPFVLLKCKNIRLSNLTIDWQVPFHCEATVAKVEPDGRRVELEIHDEFQFRVDDGQFYFAGEGFEQEGIKNLLEFDRASRETRSMVWDNYFMSRQGKPRLTYRATQVGDRRVRLDLPNGLRSVPIEGNIFAMMPPKRLAPAIFVEDCTRVTLERVTIHHSGCMGLICQTSSDIDMIDSAVVPSGERIVSTTVDATHFVNCAGTIRVDNCDFSNHIDDAVNVHGIYVRVKSRLDDSRLRVEYYDHQQRGVKTIRPGDFVTLADGINVDVYLSAVVEDVEYLDAREAIVNLSPDLPESVREGDVINVLNRQANLLLRNNRIGKNRARGILISTAGQVLVEGNHFHTPGSAIRISGGVDFWYESGPVYRALIRNNVFDHCKYGNWGRSVIDAVCVDSNEADSSSPYHGTIAIVDNEFRTHTSGLLTAYRVDHLVFRRNRIRLEPYGQLESSGPPVLSLTTVRLESVSDNDVTGSAPIQIEEASG
jgi:hypothetical protein